MSREEAESELMQIYGSLSEEKKKALDVAFKAMEQEPCDVFDEYGNYKYPSDFELTEPNTATSMPSGDLIQRQAVLDIVDGYSESQSNVEDVTQDIISDIMVLPPVKPQESYDFAKWVATEIFDEWEYNKDAFAEIACRKLAKLGIVRAKGDEWELVEPQESEE